MSSTRERLIARYGHPIEDRKKFEAQWIVKWDIPNNICTHIPALPNSLLCNRDFVPVLQKWFQEMINHRVYSEIKTFEGCYNPYHPDNTKARLSLYAWGLAIGLNGLENPKGYSKNECLKMGLHPFSDQFILLAENNFLTAGANWEKSPNVGHFQFDGHI